MAKKQPPIDGRTDVSVPEDAPAIGGTNPSIVISMDCDHSTVQFFLYGNRMALACPTCGRLFGHLRDDGYFDAHNPRSLPSKDVPA